MQIRRTGHPNLTRTFHRKEEAIAWGRSQEVRFDADGNNDNQITAGELHSFVTEKVERQSGFKQTPDLQGDAGREIVRFQ